MWFTPAKREVAFAPETIRTYQTDFPITGLLEERVLDLFDLSGDDKLGCQDAIAVALAILENKSLERLSLRNCGLGDAGINLVAMALEQLSAMRRRECSLSW